MKKNYISAVAAHISSICALVITHASTITIPGGQIVSLAEAPSASEVTSFFKGLKVIGTAISGICTITAMIFFVINLTRLSTSAGNDLQRTRALKGIMFSGISLALFGGITVVVSIFWNFV